jgi:hypothetical protein
VKLQFLLTLAVLWPLLAGCGESRRETFPVSGAVRFPDGSTLPGGMVEFQSLDPAAEQLNARGEIQSDGSYRLTTYEEGDGAIAGEHLVVVLPPADPVVSNMSGPPPQHVLDLRYQSYDSSGLKFTVRPGANEYPIQVERPQ